LGRGFFKCFLTQIPGHGGQRAGGGEQSVFQRGGGWGEKGKGGGGKGGEQRGEKKKKGKPPPAPGRVFSKKIGGDAGLLVVDLGTTPLGLD